LEIFNIQKELLDYFLEGKLFNPPSNNKFQIQVIGNCPTKGVLQNSHGT